jgi:hypothetical protein
MSDKSKSTYVNWSGDIAGIRKEPKDKELYARFLSKLCAAQYLLPMQKDGQPCYAVPRDGGGKFLAVFTETKEMRRLVSVKTPFDLVSFAKLSGILADDKKIKGIVFNVMSASLTLTRAQFVDIEGKASDNRAT